MSCHNSVFNCTVKTTTAIPGVSSWNIVMMYNDFEITKRNLKYTACPMHAVYKQFCCASLCCDYMMNSKCQMDHCVISSPISLRVTTIKLWIFKDINIIDLCQNMIEHIIVCIFYYVRDPFYQLFPARSQQCPVLAYAPGPIFTKKTSSYQYRDSHYKPETVVRFIIRIPVRRRLLSE